MRSRLHSLWLAVVAFIAACALGILGLPAAAFAQSPALSLDPTSGPSGTQVTVTGEGWTGPDWASGVRIDLSKVLNPGSEEPLADGIANPRPDGNGGFKDVKVSIPSTVTSGTVLNFSVLAAEGGHSAANAWFTVTGGPAGSVQAPHNNVDVSHADVATGTYAGKPGNGVESVEGSWVVPKVDCWHSPLFSRAAMWVGLTGNRAHQASGDAWLPQIGTNSSCFLGVDSYRIVFQLERGILGGTEAVADWFWPVQPGDRIDAKVVYDGKVYKGDLTQTRNGVTYKYKTQTWTIPNGSVDTARTYGLCLLESAGGASAKLASGYSPASFSSCSVDNQPAGQLPDVFQVEQTNTSVGPLTSSGGFSLTVR